MILDGHKYGESSPGNISCIMKETRISFNLDGRKRALLRTECGIKSLIFNHLKWNLSRGKRFNSNLGYGYRASTKPTGKIIPLPEKSNLPKNPVKSKMKPKTQPQSIPPRLKVRRRNEDKTLSYILTIGGSYYLFSMAFRIFNNFSSTFKSGKDFRQCFILDGWRYVLYRSVMNHPYLDNFIISTIQNKTCINL